MFIPDDFLGLLLKLAGDLRKALNDEERVRWILRVCRSGNYDLVRCLGGSEWTPLDEDVELLSKHFQRYEIFVRLPIPIPWVWWFLWNTDKRRSIGGEYEEHELEKVEKHADIVITPEYGLCSVEEREIIIDGNKLQRPYRVIRRDQLRRILRGGRL